MNSETSTLLQNARLKKTLLNSAELQRELHTLAGAAKTMGVAGISEAAAAAESFIEPYRKRNKLPAAGERHRFEKLLHALRMALPAQ